MDEQNIKTDLSIINNFNPIDSVVSSQYIEQT